MLRPVDMCTKTAERVVDVLRTKYPDSRPLTTSILDTYLNRPLELVPVDITNNTVT